ncbi:MAG: ABC transporter ATP-binding protein, partial [bacterium]
KELIELTSELKSTVIYVTHDQVEAMTMGHRLAVMNKGEVVQLDTPEKVFNEPANRFVAEFIGSPPMNFLDVEVSEKSHKKTIRADSFELELPKSMSSFSDSKAIMGFRPHDIKLVSEGGLGGRVTVVETLGAEKLIYLKVGNNSLSILVPATEKISSGEHLHFEINKDHLHLFNRDDEKRILFPTES